MDKQLVEGESAKTPPKLCSRCGLLPRRPGKRNTWCLRCKAESGKTIRKQWLQNGKCPRCGQHPVLPGMKSCAECSFERISEGRKTRRARKLAAVQYKGGKCQDCGLQTEYLDVYDFHHLDPTTKDFNVASSKGIEWVHVQKELDKCILLCANCHRIRHAKANESKSNSRNLET